MRKSISIRFLFLQILLLSFAIRAIAVGLPFIKYYYPQDYHAHNRNFDITISENGTVYVANFEGLLYYDNANWHTIHTTGLTRITKLFRDSKNTIWCGGYNYFGKVIRKPNGEVDLKRISEPHLFRGEVVDIKEEDGLIRFYTDDGQCYHLKNDIIVRDKKASVNHSNDKEDTYQITDTEQAIPLDKDIQAIIKKGKGVHITDKLGNIVYTIDEMSGLYNEVLDIAYDGHGRLWGVTNSGIFSAAVPSMFTHITTNIEQSEEMLSIEDFNGKKYLGTINGLYYLEGNTTIKVKGVNYACWEMEKMPQYLLIATANGIYSVNKDNIATQLTTNSTTAILIDSTRIYSGEIDGVYLMQTDNFSKKQKLSDLKVNKFMKDEDGKIWIQTIFGEIWWKETNDDTFKPYNKSEDVASTIVKLDGKIVVISAETTTPVPYPQFSFTDITGTTWLTNNEGKHLYQWKNNKRQTIFDQILFPFRNMTVRSLLYKDNKIWIGNEKGLNIIDISVKDPALKKKPKLYIRSVIAGTDSVLWGGHGDMPKQFPALNSNERNIFIDYAVDYEPIIGKTLYRYQLNNNGWSAWEEKTDADLVNLPYGSYIFMVQARDAFGRVTEITEFEFAIKFPILLRWYMLVFYLIILAFILYLLLKIRTRKLEMDKMKLEKMIQVRTAEVVKQKDEIEEKSHRLETALNDLEETQNELIRQEKMATVGKLTQGLIDRILNPLNYIINFSKLSEGLVRDIAENINDDKDKMDEENYEDTIEVLNMLKGNLKTVGEHGQNTTRTLKAMEEMLKDRSGGIIRMNLTELLGNVEIMLKKYFEKEIAEHQIQCRFTIPEDHLYINANPDQMRKTLLSMLGNAIYAVIKMSKHHKEEKEPFQPEVALRCLAEGEEINIVIHDNGIGIEKTIINKIFDPFFTTKTTGEASGIGLYLSREIIQNYGGDIQVASVKNEYTEFTITLPSLQN